MASIRESYSAVFLYDYIRKLDRKIIEMIDNDEELRSVRLKADTVEDIDMKLVQKLYDKVEFIKSMMSDDRAQL